ncbi:LPD38 domain-containing protein [Aeromonas caviae]|uniref:LPD38 domain-containing protein n=1 Tax=Aeromonas caviae TaxID=648 RepID=UPI003EC5C098
MSDRRMPTYEDFLRQEMRNIPQPDPEPTSDQGIFGDTIDMFQRGVGQTFGGDAETLGQLTDSQTIKDTGRAISDWGEGQMQEVSPEMRAAMDKQFVVENPDGSISAGDAWADPRAYWGNFATVLGQFAGLIGGTKGAGVVAKPLIRGMANRLATDLVEGEAKRLVAKATVKDALKSGTMDSVRAAYAAAPTAVAKKAVIDKAVGQLAFIGYGAHAGAMASGMRAQQAERETRDYLNNLGPDALNENADYQSAYWGLADGEMNGADPGEIRSAAISYLSEQAASNAFQDPRALASDFASGLLTGAGGGIGGVLGKVGQTRAGAAVRGFVGEGATEGWQGAETQRAVNEAVQEWADETRDPMAGVLVAGLNEAIVGGMAGGGLAGVVGPEVHINKPVVRTVTGNERIDQGIGHLDQRQAERGAAIEREIDTLFAGKQNPLGASGQVFDPVRDIPAYERQGFVRGSHDFKGTEIPGPLEGELLPPETGLVPQSDSTGLVSQGGTSAQELAELAGGRMPPSGRPAVTDQPAQIGQSDTIFVPGKPGADTRNSEYTPPRLSRDQVDRTLGEESTRDPRSPVSQAIANAGSATDSVFGPLQSLRVTKRGKPFASQKEALLASRADEQPVALNGGGFGIANRGEVEQAKAADQVTDFADRPTINVSGDSVTVPSSAEGAASQPQAEVRDEQIAPISSISSEGQSDQPGAGVPTAAGAEPAITGFADGAGAGDRADLAAPAPVPDGQQQDDQALTAPAADAGVVVSGAAQPEPATDPVATPAASEPVQQIEAARAEVAPEPTEAQKEAGNYKKGHLKLQGLDIALENPKGSTRSGTDQDGKAWQSTMAHDYGYIKRTLGADGDHVDVFIGDQPQSETVYVVDQVDPKTGKFDEHKVMMGFADEQAAREGYLGNYEAGWKGLGAIKAMPVDEFKRWVKEGDTTKPVVKKARMSQQHGLSVDEAQRIADNFMQEYNGNIPIQIRVKQNQEELYGPGTSKKDLGYGIEGSYSPERGVLGLVSGVLRTEADARRVLRHEALGHYGLDTFTPKDKSALLQKLIDAKNEKWIAPVWQQIAGDSVYGKKGDLHQAEEVFAHIAEGEFPPRTTQAWSDIKTEFSRMLRRAGLVKGPIKEHELDSLIRAVGTGIRNGKRTKQNIRSDHEVIGRDADEFAKPGKPERIIRFSKQAMAQGNKPAKHLTRKEAELVAREWFKQYRGASGIDVQIHATQAELEGALGLDAKDGLIRRAAFDDDAGTLHVAADTISDPKRMREILRHEVLAHYGLANVLGDGEYTKLMSRLIQSQKDPSMKPVWDWVNTHYADEDIGTQAEEVVAHLAEVEQGAWGRGWDRVVAMVTRALRAVGFVPDGITAAETRSLIEGLGKKLKRSGPDDNGPDGDKKFSQEVDLPTEISQDSVGKTLDVSGVERPTINHDGKPIHQTEEGLRNFWRWFGNSLMRDGAGNPVVVYHATESDITAFNTRGAVENQSFYYGEDNGREKDAGGFFFTPDKTLANDYAETRPNANIIPVYLKLNNPVYLDEMSLEEQGNYLREARANGHDGAIIGDGLEYVVFTPEQIKSAIGNNGEYSKSNPDVRFSQTNTAADAAMEKLNLGPKPDIIDKTKASLNKLRQVDRGVVSSWIDRVIKKANTEVLDALAPIKYAEEAAGITDAADSGYVAARMATGAASTMQATMLYGLPEWNDGVIQRKAGTGEKDALLGIFADLGADLHNWLGWMAGHRAELLMAQGRENLLDANDIAALKGQGKGKEAKFLDAKARWNRLNAATLDLAQEAGLFTKEARAEFESEWYIPFFRESDDGDVIAPFKTKGIANQNAGIKKLKGGEANTNDLLENIFTSTSKLIDASMKNMAAQKTVWNLADTGIIEVIPKPNKMDYQALANGKDRIMVKLEGEDYMIRVEDPDLYRAMTFFDRKPFGAMVNVAAKAKRLLTAGVTASPEFMLRNFLRDSLSSWAISKDGFKPMIDSIKGVKKTLTMDGSTIDVMFSGASFLGGYVNGNDPEAMADTVRKSLRRKGMTPEQIAKYEKSIVRNAAQVKGIVADAWDQYSRYGEALENANREAVYEAAIKAGKSHAQAAFESKDLMDFSMLGAARFIQGASMVLPFFNARIQGLGKLSRELRDNPREIAKRAGMITAMSLGLLALNWDDERYEELPDWDKDANWHFFIGDQHFRIPKPFEIGVMFGTIPERMVRAMGGKDTGAQFGKAVARAVGETFALNPTPQIVKPLVESYFNYDAFRGGPIENAQDLAVQAEARYNEQTSLMMRELGDTLGMSPKKLEHLLIGYTGTMGSYVMAAADGLIRASTPGESASWRADEIPLVKAVYRGTGPAKSTQHMEEFYRMLNEVNQLKRTVDQYRSEGLTDKANELLEEQGGILKSRRSLSRTQQQVRVVRNRIELIQRDRTLTAEEKRRRIDEMLARRNDLVYQAVNKNKANWE